MTDKTPRDDAFDAIFGSEPASQEQTAPQSPSRAAEPAAPSSRREARERAAELAGEQPAPPSDPESQQDAAHVRPQNDAPQEKTSRAARRAAAADYPPREKRKKTGWLAALVVLVLVGGIGGGGFYVWKTFEPQIRSVMGWQEPIDFEGDGSGEALVSISEGDTGTDIARTLKNSGVTKTTEAFYELLLTQSSEPVFHPGVYQLAKKMSAQSALDALLDPENKIERTVLLREGITGPEILAELSAGTEIPIEEFQAAIADPTIYGVPAEAVSIEGWLFPALYTFDPGLNAQQVIQILVDRTIKSLDDAGVPPADRERILIIASIIEREARLEDDFYKVSRVIQNRLDIDMKLEMDSTAQYTDTAKSGSVWSSKEALESDNPWNTYQRTGLPVGPIASPGDTAIDAAMSPADGPWLFFVTVDLDTGETVFTTTLSEHEAAVKQLRAWCAENPDKGC